MKARRRIRLALLATLACGALGQTRRVVILKADGLGAAAIERYLNERDPKTGKTALPWIERVFVQQGARLNNFYVRGISLSVPSWSLLDTGRHLLIRGNAEYDRATGHVYDYLNFFPFYFRNARRARADMPGIEVLDESGVPLLIDSFQRHEQLQGMQLLQRGVRWQTLKNALSKRVRTRSMRQLFNEWQTGFELTEALREQIERELVAALANERVAYLDYFFTDYDHTMHLSNDEASQRQVLEKLDRLVGRLWTAIGKSPLARATTLVLVSDHGINSHPSIYSQGYNLIALFTSPDAGGHHVLTNRHPLTEYKLKGLDPFISQVVTPSSGSRYLHGESNEYPTAMMDPDGNERAAVYLRSSAVNEMHLWLKRARDASLSSDVRLDAANRFMGIVDGRRPRWKLEAAELEAELEALRRAGERRQAAAPEKAPRWTVEQRDRDLPSVWRRQRSELGSWRRQLQSYAAHAAWLQTVLAATPQEIVSGKPGAGSLIPRRVLLDRNDLHELRNYAVNLTAAGFERVNYLKLLTAVRTRNNVQSGVSPKPVDFIATTLPKESARAALLESEWPDRDPILLYGAEDRQALLLVQNGLIRYLPVRDVTQDASGRIAFERQEWVADLPLRYFEDPDFVPDPAAFLAAWHTEEEWFRATHRTRYSNGVIGLVEHFGPVAIGERSSLWEGAGQDAPLLRRFAQRLRVMTAPDLLVMANDHWNFNVRGFNPGGNHGAFLRASTHSVLMLAGGGVPRGVAIDRPYDSLSFVPAIVALMGRGDPRDYPGPVIEELLPATSAPRR